MDVLAKLSDRRHQERTYFNIHSLEYQINPKNRSAILQHSIKKSTVMFLVSLIYS
jgi:hypothetical protein